MYMEEVCLNPTLPPTLSGDTVVSLHELAFLVRFYRADDPEGQTVAYSLGGVDADDFEVSQVVGLLMFRGRFVDYEDPKDSDRDNVYRVEVHVSDRRDADGNADGAIDDTVAVTVTVFDVNEHPRLLSGPEAVDYEEDGTAAVVSYEAEDPEGETIDWSLAGDDAAGFTIGGGQLRFRSRPDFEDPHDHDLDNEYRVTVTASDSALASEIEVAVNVVDVDEGLVLTGDQSVSHPENTAPVGAYSAVDPDGAAVLWSLAAPYYDDEWFTVTGDGMLSFRLAPDYEDPADGDGDNVYNVWLVARGGGNIAQRRVAVTVTDEDDPGTVTLPPQQPRVGTELNAELSDPDGPVSGTGWLWERSVGQTDWSETDEPGAKSYTPKTTDVGSYLRVTVTYTDRHGPDKFARAQALDRAAPERAPEIEVEKEVALPGGAVGIAAEPVS